MADKSVALHLDSVEGVEVGRDPRTMTVHELAAAGHDARSRGRAIRAKCIDCCCGNKAEVRRCVAVACALWPFRMGSNPWHGSALRSSADVPEIDGFSAATGAAEGDGSGVAALAGNAANGGVSDD